MPAYPGAVLIPLGRLRVSRSPLGTRHPVAFPTRIRQPETSMVVPNEEPKTPAQPNKPARSTVKVAGLATPGAIVEIEMVAVKKLP